MLSICIIYIDIIENGIIILHDLKSDLINIYLFFIIIEEMTVLYMNKIIINNFRTFFSFLL